MFTDRLFAFRVPDTDSAMVACPRGGRWHPAEVRYPETLPDRTRVTLQRYSCHPLIARAMLQPEPFDPRWTCHEAGLGAAYLDTVPSRAGLLDVDLRRSSMAAVTQSPATVHADGYRSREPGRIVVPCPSCGLWHATDLDDTPEPGYRFTAVGYSPTQTRPAPPCPAMRIIVREPMWHSSWAQRGQDGRRRTVEVSATYIDATGSHRLTPARV